MPNWESNKNSWKDNEHECDYHDKKDDCFCCELKENGCCCESDRDHCEDKKHECDCHDKKEHDWKDKKDVCCCKESMRDALNLLSIPKIKSFVKFNKFAFVGRNFILGATLENGSNNDNLSQPCAHFCGFDSCNCDLIKISPSENVFYPIPHGYCLAEPAVQTQVENKKPGGGSGGGSQPCPILSVNHASLCDIKVVKFEISGDKPEFEAILAKFLDEYHKKCCNKCDKCCCNDSIFNSIFSPFSPNCQIGLTASWFAISDAKVIGKIGNVLVLSNPDHGVMDKTFYFVCLDAIGFLNF